MGGTHELHQLERVGLVETGRGLRGHGVDQRGGPAELGGQPWPGRGEGLVAQDASGDRLASEATGDCVAAEDRIHLVHRRGDERWSRHRVISHEPQDGCLLGETAGVFVERALQDELLALPRHDGIDSPRLTRGTA